MLFGRRTPAAPRARAGPFALVLSGACAATAPACAPPPPEEMEVTFDPCEPIVIDVAAGATDAQRASVAEGASMWNEIAGTALTTESIPGAERIALDFEEAAAVFYGVYLPDDGEILINEGLESDRGRAVTVAHEIGHAFGMWHVEERDSVMNAGNTSIEPNPGDVAYLEDLWGGCGVWEAAP